MNTFWCSMLPSIVGIGAALVGGLIGWYLRRPRIQELESILDERHAEYMHIKNANEMLNMKHDNLQNTHTLLTLSHNSLEEREKLYPLFSKYIQWLKENNWYDSNITCFEYLEK